MAINETQPMPQAQGQTGHGTEGLAQATAPQMEGQSRPATPQQGTTPFRDWASI